MGDEGQSSQATPLVGPGCVCLCALLPCPVDALRSIFHSPWRLHIPVTHLEKEDASMYVLCTLVSYFSLSVVDHAFVLILSLLFFFSCLMLLLLLLLLSHVVFAVGVVVACACFA